MITTLHEALATITAEQVITTAAAMPLIFAYACRFIGISWFTTRFDVVAFNFVMLVLCGLVLYRSAIGVSEPMDWMALAVAFLWLRISWFSWGLGRPPAHVITRPAPLAPVRARSRWEQD